MIIPKIPNDRKAWYIKTPPTTEPITVSELKTFARIDDDEEDTLLSMIITGVRETMEEFLGRALIKQTIVLQFDFWKKIATELPRPKLISIVSVKETDEDGTETIYASDNYYTDTISEPGRILLKTDADAPLNEDRDYAAWAVEYYAGYGENASDVPSSIRLCLLTWATMVYENRAECTKVPEEIKSKLNMYKIYYI